ncbi:MAG: glycosyltransferase family 4 protein [Armatimonadia bacterium]
MRIAIYHNVPSGGAKRVAYEHCKRLVAAGHEVTVFQPSTADLAFCDLGQVATRQVTLPLSMGHLPASAPTKLRMAIYHAKLARGYRNLARLQAQIARQIDEEGFDLLYAHHDMYETAPSLLRLTRLPSVYFCQEPSRGVFEAPLVAEGHPPMCARNFTHMVLKSLFGNPTGEAMLRFRRMNERINTLAATLVLANSTYSCESILRAHGCVARRCTLGVDVDFFTPGEEKQDYVLSVGAFDPLKGFRFLIRALGCVPSGSRLPLIIAGDRGVAGEEGRLHELAREYGVELTTRPAVKDQDLRDLYRKARLFLYAPYIEPLGLTPLEAMACGTPVLGVREGGVRETVVDGHCGRLADRNEEQYAQIMAELLADGGQTDALGQRAVQYVRDNWTWDRSVEELLAAFALAREGRPSCAPQPAGPA